MEHELLLGVDGVWGMPFGQKLPPPPSVQAQLTQEGNQIPRGVSPQQKYVPGHIQGHADNIQHVLNEFGAIGIGLSPWKTWQQSIREIRDPEKMKFRLRLTGPVKAAIALIERWQIDNEAGARILGADSGEFIVNLRNGIRTLQNRDEKDRLRILLDIYEAVHSLFKDADTERCWIRTPIPELSECSILYLMTEGHFANLLRVHDFVDHVNQRF